MAKKTPNKNTINWPGAFQNVLMASINKGQLPVLLVGVILLVLIIKIPSQEAASIFYKTIDALEHYHILGWIFSFVLTLLWFFNSKRVRRVHANEMKRIAEEKTHLQSSAHGMKMPSSNKNKRKGG